MVAEQFPGEKLSRRDPSASGRWLGSRRVKGDYHRFKQQHNPAIITVPHPKRDLSLGVLKNIERIARIKLI